MAHVRHIEDVMGTVFTVDARFDNWSHEQVQAEVRNACLLLHEIDRTFSTWRDDSPISLLRANAISVRELPQVVRDVLDQCGQACEISGGWFDPWAARGGVDPTGYVKGWAGQQVLDALRDAGAEAGLVNAAGDVVGFGGPAPDRPWRVGVTDPLSPSQLLGVVPLADQALAVSGTYERGSHIFDPADGLATSSHVVCAAVLGSELGMADALATGLVAGGDLALDVVSQLADHAALLIFDDGHERRCGKFPLSLAPSSVDSRQTRAS